MDYNSRFDRETVDQDNGDEWQCQAVSERWYDRAFKVNDAQLLGWDYVNAE